MIFESCFKHREMLAHEVYKHAAKQWDWGQSWLAMPGNWALDDDWSNLGRQTERFQKAK